MKSKFFLLAFALCSLFAVAANNDSVRIEINIPQLKNQEVFFCYYFDEQIYKQDSVFLSGEGKGIIHNKEKFPEGQYLLYLQPKMIDILLSDDQTFSITIDTTDWVNGVEIKGAKQTEALNAYTQFLNAQQQKRSLIIEEYESLPDDRRDAAATENRLNILNNEVSQFQDRIRSQYKDKWLTSFLQGVEPVRGPYPVPKTREEYDEEFRYQKDHYFDNINLQDSRFWRTNYFSQKVIAYMDHQLERQSDTLANAASRLVALSMGDSVCFQMMLSKLVNYALKSNIMGMENIWMKLVEDYYRLGVVTWVDSSHLASIEREYDKLRYNRIGMTAYNMPLSDPDGKKVNLFDTGKKYTLLYFFEPSCGHCKETTPKVYEQIYKKYAEKGLDVVAVYMLTDKQEWMDFVEEKHLKGEHWHNLWDPDRKSSYWKYYDTSVTPAVYVLDENKKIIAKKIDVETMDIVFAKFLNPAPAE